MAERQTHQINKSSYQSISSITYAIFYLILTWTFPTESIISLLLFDKLSQYHWDNDSRHVKCSNPLLLNYYVNKEFRFRINYKFPFASFNALEN